MSDWVNTLIDRAANAVPQLDLDMIANVPQEKFRAFLGKLSAEDRAHVVGWAKSALEIREDGTLSRDEKKSRLLALDTTSTIFGLLRALLEAVASRVPEAQRGMISHGFGLAAVAAAGLNREFAGITAIALRAGLPAFVLGEAGGKFCRFVVDNGSAPSDGSTDTSNN